MGIFGDEHGDDRTKLYTNYSCTMRWYALQLIEVRGTSNVACINPSSVIPSPTALIQRRIPPGARLGASATLQIGRQHRSPFLAGRTCRCAMCRIHGCRRLLSLLLEACGRRCGGWLALRLPRAASTCEATPRPCRDEGVRRRPRGECESETSCIDERHGYKRADDSADVGGALPERGHLCRVKESTKMRVGAEIRARARAPVGGVLSEGVGEPDSSGARQCPMRRCVARR